MKKIIDGKLYDTEKATLLGEWDNRCYGSFDYCSEDLYQKRSGEFFLHGIGGAMSKYAVHSGCSNWGSGEKIIPLTYDAAQKWTAEHLDVNEYETIFGEIKEDDRRMNITISVSTSTAEIAKRIAARRGTSLSAIIEELILRENEKSK